jgi:hypothetical protein
MKTVWSLTQTSREVPERQTTDSVQESNPVGGAFGWRFSAKE